MQNLTNNIKLIICDVDGTLIGRDEVLSTKAIDLSNYLRKKGYMFTIASGRVEDMAKDYVEKLNIDIPYIASNGSTIADLEKVYSKNKVQARGLGKIMKNALDMGMTLVYTIDGKEYVVNETDWIFEQRDKFDRYHDMSPFTFEELLNQNIDKLMIMDSKRDGRIQILEDLAKDLGNEYSYTRYTNKSIEVVDKNASKAKALKELSEMLDIKLENVMAIGDHMNDIDMIKEAGIGACVNNAKDELKEVSDYISDYKEIDGVIDAINTCLDLDFNGGGLN